MAHPGRMPRNRGYTLIELLVVMAAIGLLLAIAAPRYVQHVDRAREVVLRQNLAAVRDAIDKFHADRTRYPKDLNELVTERYLRQLPVDPILDRTDAWLLVPASDTANDAIKDIRSTAGGKGRDGTPYVTW